MLSRRRTRVLQTRLRKAGLITCRVDGDYGPSTTRHVRAFQHAYARSTKPLPETGRCSHGDRTWRCLWLASRSGKVSRRFYFSQFQCHDPRNPTIFEGDNGLDRELVRGLERLWDIDGGPIHIISGFRTQAHNARVGGESASRHLVGDAADISRSDNVTVAEAERAGFDGIGDDNGIVLHGDFRGYVSRWEYD